MQWDRSAAEAAMSGSARGLGVCDVLRVELAAVQRAGLAAALDARIAALASGEPAGAARRGEQRRLLRRMRAGLPDREDAPPALVGPAGLVLELVDGCLADAVRALAQRLEESPWPAWSPALAAEAARAGAWIATALDCRAVDGFCFETGVDPGHAW
jgi:hypothetical protein